MEFNIEEINHKIFTIRNKKVMLDSDLSKLYQVETKNLNKAVKRNFKRFPDDFMFQLTSDEVENLRCQIGTANFNMRRVLPYVFTEQGIAMLSGLLKSDIAISINIKIMRTFVEIRKYVLTNDELSKKIEDINKRVTKGEELDVKLMEILTELISKQSKLDELRPSKTQDKIGFLKADV